MKTHYPNAYTKNMLRKAKRTNTDLGNPVCGLRDRGGFLVSVNVDLNIEEVDCKRCLKIIERKQKK